MTAAYRCLHSSGWQIVFINASIERQTLRCGLVFFAGNLPGLPLQIYDVDTKIAVGKIIVPDDLQAMPSHIWLHDPLDTLEIEVSQ